MGAYPKENIGANLLVRQGAKPQTAADDTYINSEIYDLMAAAMQNPQSALAIAIIAFTSSSGNSTGKNTLTLNVFHATVSNMSVEASLDSDTYIYTWVADGANDGVHILPVKLTASNRYVRVKAKLTESGTITIASQTLATCMVFGGMQTQPSSSYAAAGYEETTEPS